MEEQMVDTPTTLTLKAQQRTQLQPDSHYTFWLNEDQLVALRRHDLPDSAALALAAITGAAYGARKADWIILSPRTMDAYQRGYRWWLRATKALEVAGLIECQRHAGRMPRYRVVVQPKARSLSIASREASA